MTALPDSVAAFVRQLATDHVWHATMQLKPLHPVVANLLANQPLPEHWQAVILGWPRVSDDDAAMLAYAPNEEKALKGIVTTTTPAKYIRKFWVDMADHTIRDVVARVANEANFRWFTTADDIVRGVQEGPRSCMQKDWFDTPGNPHPYRAYAPELGWRMAVRLGPEGRIDGRALVYTSGTESVFVRSYKRTFEKCYSTGRMVESYSQSDTALEAWLWDQDITKADGWDDGTKLAKVLNRSEDAQVPYLDGCNDRFNFIDDHIVIEDGGRYCADCQDGSYSDEGGDWRTCWHCGERFDASGGEYIYAGFGDAHAVGNCCSDEFMQVRGRNGESYYVHEDYVATVDGVHYDEDYLDDNGVIELHDGTYEKEDHAVQSAWDDEWYRLTEVVDTQDLGHVPKEHAWQCEASGNWYSDEEEFIEAEGKKYHPDHAPDECDEEEDDSAAPLSEPQTAALDALLAA